MLTLNDICTNFRASFQRVPREKFDCKIENFMLILFRAVNRKMKEMKRRIFSYPVITENVNRKHRTALSARKTRTHVMSHFSQLLEKTDYLVEIAESLHEQRIQDKTDIEIRHLY